VNDDDLRHLERCVDLAEEAVEHGDEPFGSLLVTADGRVRREDRNRVNSGGDATLHPEFELARWAATHLTAAERSTATVYTSGEHCPMCSAAHAWVGLGRIVFAGSTAQLTAWAEELGLPPSPIFALGVDDVVRHLETEGPAEQFAVRIRALHQRAVRPPSTTNG
jgi:tRNA(Arg) A34 adenosine deaminase TadA